MNLAELGSLLKADLSRLSVVIAPARINWLKIFNPRFHPVLLVRIARYCYLHRGLKIFSHLFTWLNVFIYGIEFTPRCEVGPGLLLPHTVGTVVGAVRIGKNATIFQGVTLGASHLDLNFDIKSRPSLGDNVMVGAGAKVLGGISIGSGVKVGANAVVTHSVEDNQVAIGVPAKRLNSTKNAVS